jgi:hypothetical protein
MRVDVANIEDLEEIVALHISNYDPNELSIFLGEPYIRCFYKIIIKSKEIDILVVREESDKVICISVAFYRYLMFRIIYKKEIAKLLLFDILKSCFYFSGWIRIIQILKRLKHDILKNIPGESHNHHLGSLIIDKHYRDNIHAVILFTKVLRKNFLELIGKGTFWASANINNDKSIALLQSLGLRKLYIVNAFPLDIQDLIGGNLNKGKHED